MVAAAANVVGALMATKLAGPEPRVTLSRALKALPVVTVTAALAMTADAKVVAAATFKVLLLFVPTEALPKAENKLPPATVRAAFAVIGAVTEKVVAALTSTV